jgi:hypothetical protein
MYFAGLNHISLREVPAADRHFETVIADRKISRFQAIIARPLLELRIIKPLLGEDVVSR